jgi:HD-like signal output (HDOD) protein
MSSITIGLVLLVAVAVAALLLLRRRPAGPAAEPMARTTSPVPALADTPRPATAAGATAFTPARALAAPPPPELAGFTLVRAVDLSPDKAARYTATFRDVPRPPRLLHQLLSPDFVNDASSAQLADLIRPEPLLAVKVLAAVNSPLYGLQRPVAGVDQAVVYLGVDTVRSLCMQYMLMASFRTDRPECQRLLDTVWAASAMASELAQRLAQQLGLDQRGALVSSVVLSFLGRLATVAATPAGILSTIPPRGLLERKDAEQRKLGLSASEIGRLLMTEWQLPAEVTADAADLDRLLAQVQPDPDGARSNRLALGYLCARLGERLAHDELARLSDFDLDTDPSLELFHLQPHFDPIVQARLPRLLKDPALSQVIARLQPADR